MKWAFLALCKKSICYNAIVGWEIHRDGLFENVETKMTSTAKRVPQTNSDTMHDIEGRHFGRCVDQVWAAGRRTLIELMDYPKARCQAVIVKQYDTPVPKSGSGKDWPALISAYVYIPVDDDSNSWTGLDKALRKFELDRVPAVTSLGRDEVGI